jgi:hypothetical protein
MEGDNIKTDIKYILGVSKNSTGSRYRLVTGSCENHNEPPAYLKGGEFLDQVLCYWFLENSIPCNS